MGTRGFLRMLIDLSWLNSLDIFSLSKVSPLCSVSWLSASNRTHFPIPLSSKVSHYQKVKVDFPIFSSKWVPLPKCLFSLFHDHIVVQFVDSIVWRKGKVERLMWFKSYSMQNFHSMPLSKKICQGLVSLIRTNIESVTFEFRFRIPSFPSAGGFPPLFSYHGRQHFILGGIYIQRQKR